MYQDCIDRASKEEMGYAEFLGGLLSEEICAREENQIKRRMRQAGFPFQKTIEQFDFSLRPELKRQVVLNCMDETFIHQGRSMVLIGPPGTGKTHVSISVGIKMIQLGYSVRFVMAQGLINDYVGMKDVGDRQELLRSPT